MTILTCLDRLQESKLNVIDLSDDGILLVSNLVAFLYTGNYPANSATSGMDDPITYAQCIDQLHKIAVKPRTSGAHPNNIQPTSQKANPPKKSPNYSLHVEMYALADQYDIPALAVLAKYKLNVICEIEWDSKSFLGIVPRVYETTLESNQGLRAVVLDHARKHSNHFMKDELLKASFTSLLESTPEFGTALLFDYMTASLPSRDGAATCEGCGRDLKIGGHPHWCEKLGDIFRDGELDPRILWGQLTGFR